MQTTTYNALSSALTGLNIAQQLLDVTSQNIANAQTVGYTAKTLPIETQVANGQLVGVLSENVTRNINTSLQASVWTQNAITGSTSTINSSLANIQSLYGTATSGSDFSSKLTALKNDFATLSGSPSTSTQQIQTVADAQSFASALNTTAAAVTTARNAAESGISSAVSTINTQLQTIANLNVQIAQTKGAGESIADLQDQRDQAVGVLSSEMSISTYTQSSGVMVVQTTNGDVLADTSAHSLVFTAQSLGATSAYPGTVSGVYVDSATTGADLAANPAQTGGTLGGLLQLRDQILPQQQAQLDEVAEQTANRFNAQGLKLFTDPSGNIPASTNGSGQPTPANYVGFATDIQVNPAVTASPVLVQQGTTTPVPPATALDASDNTIIDKVLTYTFGLNQDASGTPNAAFNTTGLGVNTNISLSGVPSVATLEQFSQDVMGAQANQASSYTAQSTYSASYGTNLQTSLSNGSAVNLDNEVANLTVYENAYSCAAQVVSTEQKLMTDLLGILQ
jgi:flagellar hook-associated protein 1 FlgK